MARSEVSVAPDTDIMQVSGGFGGHGEFASEDALDGPEVARQLLQLAEFSLYRDDLEALVVVEVHVDGGGDGLECRMLDLSEFVAQSVGVVVVDHGDDTAHEVLIVLPFVLGEGIANQVTDRFGSADVSFFLDDLIEFVEELRL